MRRYTVLLLALLITVSALPARAQMVCCDGPTYKIVYQTVYDEKQVTAYRIEYDTVYDEKTVFAVQVAQTTKRPLLLRGPAGSGKSSLAPFVANTLKEPFYPFVVNARTQARDMMCEFDALGRLNDANVSASDKQAKNAYRIAATT